MKMRILFAVATAALCSVAANATPITETSPTGGVLPGTVTKVGGIVLDLKGTNNTRIVSQLAASTLFEGFVSSNSTLIGTQTGFTPATISALGGGLLSASIRLTLFDGDNAAGNFDFNQNTLSANGVSFGNFSNVSTDQTNSTGTTSLSTQLGFPNNLLATGFFTLSSATDLATFFDSLSTGSVEYRVLDVDQDSQFYDFTQGVDGGLIDVGTGPVINPPIGAVPEPATWAMMIGGFGIVGGNMRYRRRKTSVSFT